MKQNKNNHLNQFLYKKVELLKKYKMMMNFMNQLKFLLDNQMKNKKIKNLIFIIYLLLFLKFGVKLMKKNINNYKLIKVGKI